MRRKGEIPLPTVTVRMEEDAYAIFMPEEFLRAFFLFSEEYNE